MPIAYRDTSTTLGQRTAFSSSSEISACLTDDGVEVDRLLSNGYVFNETVPEVFINLSDQQL